MRSEPFKDEPNSPVATHFLDIHPYGSIPNDDMLGSDLLDELLDLQTDFKIEQHTVSDVGLEVTEDPMDPWRCVWEQPLTSVGMDFNFDAPQLTSNNLNI